MWDIIRSVSVDVPSKHRKILSVFITKKEVLTIKLINKINLNWHPEKYKI